VSISINGAYAELRLLKDGPKDGWLSDLFVRAFVYHMQYMLKAESEPAGYPIGAAALTAAAVSPLQFFVCLDLL
jgi:hypothetical protein